jgi:hypothetical protein
MPYPIRTIELYQRMMAAQKRGTFTEHNLLDFMPHFWYNGSYDEYYDTAYSPRRKKR